MKMQTTFYRNCTQCRVLGLTGMRGHNCLKPKVYHGKEVYVYSNKESDKLLTEVTQNTVFPIPA